MSTDPPPGLYARYGKRLLDLLSAAVLLVLLSPALALIALLIPLESPGPALFRQERLGWRGRVFRIYKFRTMTHAARVPGHEIFGQDPDVTRLGRWLRRLKLDELPQLWNVLFGTMSLVGPRPALPQQLAEYDAAARRRLDVRPGLTGLAQVAGNIYLTWPERWAYDAQYVERLSFGLDLWILWRTLFVVVWGEARWRVAPTPKKD